MIDYGVVVPGEDALATSYCDVTTTAHLEADGTIVWRRERYQSVSAFSLAFKRSVKPDRKADDYDVRAVRRRRRVGRKRRVRLEASRGRKRRTRGGDQFPARPRRPDA